MMPTSRRILSLSRRAPGSYTDSCGECPAAKDVGPRRFHFASDVIEDLVAFDRAYDHAHYAAADLDLADLNHRVLLVELAARELERLHDRQHLLDAGNRLERLRLQFRLVADYADDGAVFALADVGFKAELANAFEDVIKFGVGGAGSQNDDHGLRLNSVGRIKGSDTNCRRRAASKPLGR